MTKEQQINQLQAEINERQAKIDALSKGPELWIPAMRDEYYQVCANGDCPRSDRYHKNDTFHQQLARQGSIARTQEQAEWIRDFRAAIVPKCRVPEEGEKVYSITAFGHRTVWNWVNDFESWHQLNTGRLKLTPWTDEETTEYKRIMRTNTDWRFVQWLTSKNPMGDR